MLCQTQVLYNIRQNSREHSLSTSQRHTTLDKTPVDTYPPPPGVNVGSAPDFLLNIDIGGWGVGRGESVHGVLSNVVFTAGIGYPLYRTGARQGIRVADVLPQEAY